VVHEYVGILEFSTASGVRSQNAKLAAPTFEHAELPEG
jgi:hypothetical protein